MTKNRLLGRVAVALLTASLVLCNDGIGTYALTVTDGTTVMTEADGKIWQHMDIPAEEDKCAQTIDLFDNSQSVSKDILVDFTDEDLFFDSHRVDPADENSDWITDVEKSYILINGTKAQGPLNEWHNANLFKDASSTISDTKTEDKITEDSYWGGEYELTEADKNLLVLPADPDPSDKSGFIGSFYENADYFAPRMLFGFSEQQKNRDSRPAGEIAVNMDFEGDCNSTEPEDIQRRAKAEYSIDNGEFQSFEYDSGLCIMNYVDGRETVPDSVKIKLTPPSFYRNKNIVPYFEIRFDEVAFHNIGNLDWIKEEFPSNYAELEQKQDENGDYYYIYTYDTQGVTSSLDFNVFWSDYYLLGPDDDHFVLRTNIIFGDGSFEFADASGAISESDYESVRHPDGEDMPGNVKYVLKKPGDNETLDVIVTPEDGTELLAILLNDMKYVFTEYEINNPENETAWDENCQEITKGDGDSYVVHINSSMYTEENRYRDVNLEVAFSQNKFHIEPDGEVDIYFDSDDYAGVQYSVDGTTYHEYHNYRDDFSYVDPQDETKALPVTFKLTPPVIYRGKDIEPMVKLVFNYDSYDFIGNFDEHTDISLTKPDGEYNYYFTYTPSDDLPHISVKVYWSEYYHYSGGMDDVVVEVKIRDGNGGVALEKGAKDMLSHPAEAEIPDITKFIVQKPSNGEVIPVSLEPLQNCFVEEICVDDICYVFDDRQLGMKQYRWSEDLNSPIKAGENGIYFIEIDESMYGGYFTFQINIEVKFSEINQENPGHYEAVPKSYDYYGAKKLIEELDFAYAGDKASIEEDFEWDLWYNYFGYLKSKNHTGEYYGMFGTVDMDDDSKEIIDNNNDNANPYKIDFAGPTELFKDAVSLGEQEDFMGWKYYPYRIDLKKAMSNGLDPSDPEYQGWKNVDPEYIEGSVFVLDNYTDIIVAFRDADRGTRYVNVDASKDAFNRTIVFGDYGPNGEGYPYFYGNGVNMVGSTIGDNDHRYRLSGHVTQEYSNLIWRRAYTLSDGTVVNADKPGISCNLSIINTYIEGFYITTKDDKGAEIAVDWTEWPLVSTNLSKENAPLVYEIKDKISEIEIASIECDDEDSDVAVISEIESLLPKDSEYVKLAKISSESGNAYSLKLLSDYCNEIPLKITYDNGHIGYVTIKLTAKNTTAAEAEKKAADAATGLIDAIGTVEYSEASDAKIKAARKAYDALSAEAEAMVPAEKKSILTSAEAKYAELEEAAKKAEEAKQAEEAKKAEEAKQAEEAKKAEEAKQAEEAKKAEEAKQAEEARRAEEAQREAEKSQQSVVPSAAVITSAPVVPSDNTKSSDDVKTDDKKSDDKKSDDKKTDDKKSDDKVTDDGKTSEKTEPLTEEELVVAVDDAKEKAAEVFEEAPVYVAPVENTASEPEEATYKKGAYRDKDGEPLKNSFVQTESGAVKFVGDDGKAVKQSVILTVNPDTGDQTMYYTNKKGNVVKDKVVTLDNGDRMYTQPDGSVATNSKVTAKNGNEYYAGEDGILLKNQVVKSDDGKKYFTGKTGMIQKNKLVTDDKGKMHFATKTGELATNRWVTVDGVKYWCNKNGVVTKKKAVKTSTKK